MSAPQFTPGPWKVDAKASTYTPPSVAIMANGLIIAEVLAEEDGRSDDPEIIATAHLIAAAPCMAGYIRKRADAGDAEAIELWERINANS